MRKPRMGSPSSIGSFIHSFQQLYASWGPSTVLGAGATLADCTDKAPGSITPTFIGEAENRLDRQEK